MVLDFRMAFVNGFDNPTEDSNYRRAKMNKRMDYIDVILRVLIILGVILITYWFFQLMFGGSPTLIKFVFGLVFVLISLVVHLYYKSGKFNHFIEETFPRFEKNIEQSFDRIREDINLIKKKLKI